MGSERGDGHKKPGSLGEGTGTKASDNGAAPQRATASRLVPTHQADPPFPEGDKRRFGYSRDHRPDCVQIIIALVATPEGLPLKALGIPEDRICKTITNPRTNKRVAPVTLARCWSRRSPAPALTAWCPVVQPPPISTSASKRSGK